MSLSKNVQREKESSDGKAAYIRSLTIREVKTIVVVVILLIGAGYVLSMQDSTQGEVLTILIFATVLFSFRTRYLVRREENRNRILQAYIAAVVRSVTDYAGFTDTAHNTPKLNFKLPIPYENFREAVKYELEKTNPRYIFNSPKWKELYSVWLYESRQLFTDKWEYMDGFVMMNYDVFDYIIDEHGDKNPQ